MNQMLIYIEVKGSWHDKNYFNEYVQEMKYKAHELSLKHNKQVEMSVLDISL